MYEGKYIRDVILYRCIGWDESQVSTIVSLYTIYLGASHNVFRDIANCKCNMPSGGTLYLVSAKQFSIFEIPVRQFPSTRQTGDQLHLVT